MSQNLRRPVQHDNYLIEFDPFPDEGWDPVVLSGHVGININSLASSVHTPWDASLHSRDVVDVTVIYNSITQNLSVSWHYQNTYNVNENYNLSYKVDLSKVLPEWVTVGFSASTGIYLESHTLKSWEFSSSWDDIEETSENNKKKKIIVASSTISASLGLLIIGLVILIAFQWKRKKNEKVIEKPVILASTNHDIERGDGARRFSYNDIVSATKNFSTESKLGESGFGAIYKGYLTELDMPVAVKKIWRNSSHYKSEAEIINRLNHPNLLQLIGWFHEKGEFMLVYEFVQNGSLDYYLFGEQNTLPWGLRYKISLGLASALLYLHEECEQFVLHRNIKSSNVMLDSNFNAKLGDFYIARLMNHELTLRTGGVAGTFGYLAPEYISIGKASRKSDVYGFGVVLLEIVTGRKSIDHVMEQKSLVEWVWDLYKSEELLSAVDDKLHGNYTAEEAKCLMTVGLWCTHSVRKLRPSISQAIKVLNFEKEMPNL